MKVYMHWDMEGVSGLFTREHVWFWEDGVRPHVAAEGRRLLIADVNSAVAAALASGAEQVIVCDTHHGGGNIILEEMLADPRVTYHVRSRAVRDGKSRWMPDLDEGVDGLMLMGHHAKAGTPDAFLPHAWSLDWADFQVNGQSIGEIGIESCFAGHWDIPLILVQGDEAGCREAEAQFPGVLTAAVKHAESHDRAAGLDAATARRLTAQKVAEAIEKARRGDRPAPYKPSLPMRVTVRMTSRAAADAAAAKPFAQRVDEYTVAWNVERQCDIVKWIANAGID
jgi:D-amino peptidase